MAEAHDDAHFLRQAIELAYANTEQGGRPFGAVVVNAGEVIASAMNEILTANDPTAHAEMLAIRRASQHLASPHLQHCVVYASGHPCPMCLAAMRMAGVSQVVYAHSNADAAPFGLSTAAVYDELAKPFAMQAMPVRHVPARWESCPDFTPIGNAVKSRPEAGIKQAVAMKTRGV